MFDLSLKHYDFLDRRYDTIGTRGSAVLAISMGLIPVGLALLVQVFRVLPGPGGVVSIAPVLLLLLGFTIRNAVRAARGREVKVLPAPDVLYRQFAAETEHHVRCEVVALLTEACDSYASACSSRSTNLTWALRGFTATLLTLLATYAWLSLRR